MSMTTSEFAHAASAIAGAPGMTWRDKGLAMLVLNLQESFPTGIGDGVLMRTAGLNETAPLRLMRRAATKAGVMFVRPSGGRQYLIYSFPTSVWPSDPS